VWDAGLILVEALSKNPSLVRGKRVIELGAGTGLVSTCAGALGASHVKVTDMEEHVPVLLDTISLNTHFGLAHVRAEALQWGSTCMEIETWDVVLGSDIVYEPKCWDALLGTIRALSSEQTSVIIAHRPRHDDDHIFWDGLRRDYVVEKMEFCSTLFALAVDVTIYVARLRGSENKGVALFCFMRGGLCMGVLLCKYVCVCNAHSHALKCVILWHKLLHRLSSKTLMQKKR
jgi:hypothetical protein